MAYPFDELPNNFLEDSISELFFMSNQLMEYVKKLQQSVFQFSSRIEYIEEELAKNVFDFNQSSSFFFKESPSLFNENLKVPQIFMQGFLSLYRAFNFEPLQRCLPSPNALIFSSLKSLNVKGHPKSNKSTHAKLTACKGTHARLIDCKGTQARHIDCKSTQARITACNSS